MGGVIRGIVVLIRELGVNLKALGLEHSVILASINNLVVGRTLLLAQRASSAYPARFFCLPRVLFYLAQPLSKLGNSMLLPAAMVLSSEGSFWGKEKTAVIVVHKLI